MNSAFAEYSLEWITIKNAVFEYKTENPKYIWLKHLMCNRSNWIDLNKG